MSSAGGTQKTWKAVVRKESADTQEYESCQLNDIGRGRGRGQGGVELRSQCGEQFRLGGVNPREGRVQSFRRRSSDGDEARLYTINCEGYNWRINGMRESKVNRKQRERVVGEKRPRGKLADGGGTECG